ncbi:MAG: glycosyltransferase family 9 protein [Nevskia sp.]|nr:glycosyltransferase family 9 protein [Nevskia sp.]
MNPSPAIPSRVLVICLRRLGDVLLATPLIRSLKQAYPNAEIDALVFAPTAGVLAGNADLHAVIAMPKKGQLALVRRLWRRYDLAVAVTNSDRAHYAAWIASGRRAAVGSLNTRWKHWLLKTIVLHDPTRLHTVVQSLLLADALGIARVPEVVPPRPADDSTLDAVLGPGWRDRPYAVLHPQPMYRYKAWTDDGWRALIRWLAAQGLRVVISGGPAEHERSAVSALLAGLDLPDDSVIDVSGHLPFAALTPMIETARLFVGPDTSVTHLAAACNTPTLALFGPSSPVTWGPWPQGWDGEADSPWRLAVPFQRIGNVGILQGDHGRQIGCIPCLQEGCERHTASPSDCLDRMTPARVIAAAAQLLGSRAPA